MNIYRKANRLRKDIARSIRLLKIKKEDIILASYPRSGITWMQFLIANLVKPDDLEIDFHTVHDIIPEFGRIDDQYQTVINKKIIKTHATYNRAYKRTIYLVRDGRDVYVSYYHYRLKQLEEGTTFGDFLRREDHYPCLWKDHIQSWYDAGLPEEDFLVIRYEDILEDARQEVRKIANFIGMQASAEDIQQAIDKSSFERMKKIDQTKGRKYNLTKTNKFVRKGKAGSWRDEFSPEDIAYFKETAGETLIQLGYEQDLNW